jgi:hypothetical protein
VRAISAPLPATRLRRAEILLAVAVVVSLAALDEVLHGIASAWLVDFSMAMTGAAQVFLPRQNRQIFN